MSLIPREAQNRLHSRFSCMLIPFSMFSRDYDEVKVEYSPLYGRGRKVKILVGRHFQSGMLPMERTSKKGSFEIFLLANQKCSFLVGLPYPPRSRSTSLLPREAPNRFFFS